MKSSTIGWALLTSLAATMTFTAPAQHTAPSCREIHLPGDFDNAALLPEYTSFKKNVRPVQ
jgi:hypothetical protein